MNIANPFAELAASISPAIMQWYVILMVILVVGGTILDMMHKKSAKYFFENAERQKARAKRDISNEKMSMAIQTLTSEVLTSSEFHNPKRRLSHLMSMYGFILFVVSTAVLIFGYAGSADAGIWSLLWYLGAFSLAIGGYWFWFFIRVDVFAEGKPWYDVGRDDIFIVGLLGTSTFGLLWAFTQGSTFGWVMFALFIIFATMLFGTVLWSKFAHMFFKPAAAFQKRTAWADGSRENLPDIPDLSDPKTHERFPDIPTYMGKNPPNMGLGIKRETPNHY